MARGCYYDINNSTCYHSCSERDVRHLWFTPTTSTEFADFLKQNGIKHIKSAPYHPSTNGAAERFVRTLKHALKCARTDQDQHQQLMSFLLSYRITPHATTNTAPSELFMGRSLRTRLDLLRPNLEESVVRKQAQQKMTHDQHSKFREFQIGQSVLARNYRLGPLWLPGIIEERTGPLSYVVKLGSGLRWKRHVDQLLSSNSNTTPTSDPIGYPPVPASSTPLSDQIPVEETKNRETTADDQEHSSESPADTRTALPETPTPPPTPSPSQPQSDAGPKTPEPRPVPPPRRSNRVRRPPSRLTYPPNS